MVGYDDVLNSHIRLDHDDFSSLILIETYRKVHRAGETSFLAVCVWVDKF